MNLLWKSISIVLLLALVPLGLFAFILDSWIGLSVYPLFSLFFIVIGLALVTVAYNLWTKPRVMVWSFPYFFGIFILPFLSLWPIKPAALMVRQVEIGMSPNEVMELFDKHFPEDGKFDRPRIRISEERIGFTVDENDGAYNASYASFRIEDGVVAKKNLSGD